MGVGDEGSHQLPSSQCPCVKVDVPGPTCNKCGYCGVLGGWGGGGVNPVHIFSRIIFLDS